VTPAEHIPQGAALHLQLAAIAGNEPESSFFEIRPLTAEGRPSPQDRAFVPVRDFAQAAGRIRSLASRLNVFVGAAPRSREDGTARAVERVWSLWSDLDGREALERLRDFRPLPSVVVRSGSPDCAHAYWPLREAVSPQWAQRANRRLAQALRADLAATDPARVLRPAGSSNHKHSPAREVACTRLELDVFTFDEVVGRLPDTSHYAPKAQPAGEHRVRGDSSRLLTGIVRAVAEAQEGNRNCALFWGACKVREHADLGELDVDRATSELRVAATHVGLPEFEIAKTIASGLAAGSKVTA
jgi:RepB DNA-primase from phage plasmid